MNKIITKLPVFESADIIKKKDEQTKQENIESLKAAAEIKMMLESVRK